MARITKTTVEENTPQASSAYSAISQFVYLVVGLVNFLLAVRFVFRLLGANAGTPIVQAVYSFTNYLMVPFRAIFPVNEAGGAVIEWSVLVAILFYSLLAWIIMRLIALAYTAEY